MNLGPVVRPGRARAHASNLFIPTTRLWAALKSRLLLGQAGFGSRNLPEISPKHRITDLYAWTLLSGPATRSHKLALSQRPQGPSLRLRVSCVAPGGSRVSVLR